MNQELPSDYEACSHCGYDHSYELPEAIQAHKEAALKVVLKGGRRYTEVADNDLVGVDYGDHIMVVKDRHSYPRMLMSLGEWHGVVVAEGYRKVLLVKA